MKHVTSERKTQVNIRLTEAEAVALAESAAEANQDLSTFVRRKALERIVKTETRRAMSARTAQIVRELSAIGISLARIIRLYEANDPQARAHLEECLGEVHAAILSLRS